jgi:hypothetical protein
MHILRITARSQKFSAILCTIAPLQKLTRGAGLGLGLVHIITQRLHIKKRAKLIKRQIAYFNQFDPRTPDRKYVGGESHLYLGRKYRLKIELSDKDKVLLKNGYFCIEATSRKPDHIEKLMDSWYRRRSKLC